MARVEAGNVVVQQADWQLCCANLRQSAVIYRFILCLKVYIECAPRVSINNVLHFVVIKGSEKFSTHKLEGVLYLLVASRMCKQKKIDWIISQQGRVAL